ncbi:MAG: peptidoglycan-binding protein [Chthoniobacterales bacterium]
MKKLLTILISCSLALAASAMAQQDEASPAPNKKHPKGEKPAAAQEAQAHPGMNQPHPGMNQAHPAREARPASEAKPMENRKAMRKQRAEANAPAETKAASEPMANPAPAAEPKAQGRNATGMHHGKMMKKDGNAPNEPANANTSANPAAATANPETAPVAANPPGKKGMGHMKKPDPQVVQKVKTEHANFKAQARPENVPTVTFNASYTLNGAAQWQGPQYEVFRSYRPQRHDQGWYRARYPRVEIIAGGAYYFNNGFWFPAWGYDPSYQYYAYDAPIYVGASARPPDRVIADVQAILQQEGYYKGEVDGLLGPLTREALVGYQTDNGLYATATIDEPTLASLDLG